MLAAPVIVLTQLSQMTSELLSVAQNDSFTIISNLVFFVRFFY